MLIKEVTYNNLINYLGMKLGHFDFEAIDIMIGEMVKNYLYERGMYKRLEDIYAETEVRLRDQLFRKEVCIYLCS